MSQPKRNSMSQAGRAAPVPFNDSSSDDDESWQSKKKPKGKTSVCATSRAKNGINNNMSDIEESDDGEDRENLTRGNKRRLSQDSSDDEETGSQGGDNPNNGGGGGPRPPNGTGPGDDPNQRRWVRSEYRSVMEDLLTNSKEYIDEGNFAITEKLVEVNNLYQKVTQTREAAMDSSTIAHIALLGKQKAQGLKTDMFTFKYIEFAEKIVTFNGGRKDQGIAEDRWNQLGVSVAKYFKKAPAFKCMLGTFERAELKGKEPKARQGPGKQSKEELMKDATKVKELDQVERKNEETTAKMTERVHNLLTTYSIEQQDNDPLDFFEFVTDPDSFGRTVENIFYVSFLVREGLARVFLDEDKLPLIQPVAKADNDAKAKNTKLFNQVVVSLSYKDWEDICKIYDIQQAWITRPKELETKSTKSKSR